MKQRPAESASHWAPPPPPSHSRRERRRQAREQRGTRRPVRHLLMPGVELRQAPARGRETVARFVSRTRWPLTRLPTICIVNGQPLPRALWRRRRIGAADQVVFFSRPFGGHLGSAGQIAGLIALVALVVIAPYAAGALGFTALAAGTLGGSLLAAGIMLGGSLLLSSLTAPKTPTPETVNPLYSINAAGNTARPLATIPVSYGRLKTFPDYAATPWSEFVGNDQVLNVLLCVGLGNYEIEQILLDSTVIWDSGGGLSGALSAQLQICPPGTPVTLFPVNVVQSSDVSGQAFPLYNAALPWLGPYVASPPGTIVNEIDIDLVLPGGCFGINDDGTQRSAVIAIHVQYQHIDDAGAPLGGWVDLFAQNLTFATRQPQRITIPTSVAGGRYQVRASRTNPTLAQAGQNGADDMVWAGMRGRIPGSQNFLGVTLIALRLLASQYLAAFSAAHFGVLRTRILPVWNGSAMVDTATRSPAWAFWDMATNPDYAAGRPPARVDFAAVVSMAAGCTARGDTFDCEFRNPATVPDAFDTSLKVTRARHRWAGDVLTLVRDEFPSIPQMLLTDREIVRGSLQVSWDFNTTDSADAVIAQYIDENTWLPADVQFPPNGGGFTAQLPATIQIEGVVNRAQMFREAAFYYLQSQRRRTRVTLTTEHDGRMLGFGAPVSVQSELPQSWGAAGCVTARAGLQLTVTPDPVFDPSGQNYVAIRTKTGGQFGPVKAYAGGTQHQILLDAADLAIVEAQGVTLDQALARMVGAEDPSYALGAASTWSKPCLLLSAQPNGDQVTLNLVVDDPLIHSTDPGTVPLVPTGPSIVDPDAPLIVGLLAVFRQGVAEPIVDASWWVSPGATSYLAQASYDAGSSWTPAYAGTNNGFSFVAARSLIRIRVQAIGRQAGPFSETGDLPPPFIQIADQAVTLASFNASLAQLVAGQIQNDSSIIDSMAKKVGWQSAEQDAHNYLDRVTAKVENGIVNTQITTLTAGLDTASAAITTNATAIAAADAAVASLTTSVTAQFSTAMADISTNATAIAAADSSIASLTTSVTAQFGSLTATVTTQATAIAGINGALAATYQIELNVHGYVSGLKFYDDGSTSAIVFSTDIFRICSAGTASTTGITVFEVGTVAGVTAVSLVGTMIQDSGITTRALNAGSITAVKMAVGAIAASNIIVNDIIVTGHLVADAATSLAFVTGAGVHPYTGVANAVTTLATLTFAVAVGPVDIVANVEIISGFLQITGAQVVETYTLSILIDGSVARTWTIYTQFLGYDAGSNTSTVAWLGDTTLPYQTTLSVGSHTIALQLKDDSLGLLGGVLAAPVNINQPSIRVLESRR